VCVELELVKFCLQYDEVQLLPHTRTLRMVLIKRMQIIKSRRIKGWLLLCELKQKGG
jgi:hypothetical protein